VLALDESTGNWRVKSSFPVVCFLSHSRFSLMFRDSRILMLKTCIF
jgi:hypothetical protein